MNGYPAYTLQEQTEQVEDIGLDSTSYSTVRQQGSSRAGRQNKGLPSDIGVPALCHTRGNTEVSPLCSQNLRDLWNRYQQDLFPRMDEALGPVAGRHKIFLTELEMVEDEYFLPSIPDRISSAKASCSAGAHCWPR